MNKKLKPPEKPYGMWGDTTREELQQEFDELYLLDLFEPEIRVLKLLRSETYESKIRKLAYIKWEKAGKPEGRDLEFWFGAESMVHFYERVGPKYNA